MRELVESIKQMYEQPEVDVSRMAGDDEYQQDDPMTAEELESLMDDVQAVMDEMDGHEQAMAEEMIENITAAMGEGDLVTASDYANELIELIRGDDSDLEDMEEGAGNVSDEFYTRWDQVKQQMYELSDAISGLEKSFVRGGSKDARPGEDLLVLQNELTKLLAYVEDDRENA